MSRPSVAVRFVTKVITLLAAFALVAGAPFALAANSVINIAGIGYMYGDTGMSQAVNGAFTGPDYTQYYINTQAEYPNQGDEAGDAIAMQSALNLVNKLQAEDPNGNIFFKTESNGGIIASRLITQMVANGQSTQNIYIVAAVNPAPGTNGYEARFPSNMNAFMTGLLGGHTTQAVGGVKILSIAGQYDGVSDAPVYWGNLLADVNAVMGFFLVHPFVYKMDLNDPRNWVAHSGDGNLTQVVVYTAQLPITMPLRVFVPGPIVDAIDRVLRPIIETAYIRPDTSDPNNPANNPNNVIMGSFAPDPSKWLGVVQRLVTGELQAFGLVPTPPNSTGTVQLPGPTASTAATTAATVPATTPTLTAATPEAKVSEPVQSSSPTVSTPSPLTATQPQAPQTSPVKPAEDSKGSGTPASTTPVSTPATQPVVTSPTTSVPSSTTPSKDQKQDNPKKSDSPKVKTPKNDDHPKGSTDSDSDAPKSGSTVSKPDTKKGDKNSDSGPKSTSDGTSPKPHDHQSHKTGDADGSKAPAHAGSGAGHHS